MLAREKYKSIKNIKGYDSNVLLLKDPELIYEKYNELRREKAFHDFPHK